MYIDGKHDNNSLSQNMVVLLINTIVKGICLNLCE